MGAGRSPAGSRVGSSVVDTKKLRAGIPNGGVELGGEGVVGVEWAESGWWPRCGSGFVSFTLRRKRFNARLLVWVRCMETE